MFTGSIDEKPDQQVLEIFDLPGKHKRGSHRVLARALNEVILGQRPFLRVYSKVLQTDFYFVNEGLVNPADKIFSGKVLTMEMLAEVVSGRQPFLQAVKELISTNRQ